MTIAPYMALMRMDKPIGIWLLFFPASWAVALAGSGPSGWVMVLMLAGAVVTRAAGCVLNDLTDRKLDRQVERTKNRPLASGAVRVWQAVLLLVGLLFVALLIALMLPVGVCLLALLALPMIAAYPWMKRITWWPQLFLGLTFNLGALFGWVATGAPLMVPALTLYAACVFWTLGYDTIYAVQDIADDARVGIRSSARRLGQERIRVFVQFCYAAMISLLLVTGYLLQVGVVFYVGVVLVAAHAGWQVKQLPVAPEKAGKLFCSNQWLGLMFLGALLVGRVV